MFNPLEKASSCFEKKQKKGSLCLEFIYKHQCVRIIF